MIADLFRLAVGGHIVAEILLGALLLLATAIVHGAGIFTVLFAYERQVELELAHARRHPILAFSLLIAVLIVTHLVEILLWALLFTSIDAIATLSEAFYFAATTYTTLGYQDVRFPVEYRILPAMLALAGVFMIGWTTGVLFAVTNGLLQSMIRTRRSRRRQ